MAGSARRRDFIGAKGEKNENVGSHVICTVGEARAGRLAELTDEDFMLGLDATLKMPAAQFVPAYQESVESHRTGEVLDVRDFVRESVASETSLY